MATTEKIVTYSERIQSSWKEAAGQAAVAGVGAYLGATALVSRAMDTTGLAGSMAPDMRGALIIAGVVFLAVMTHDVFVRESYIKVPTAETK